MSQALWLYTLLHSPQINAILPLRADTNNRLRFSVSPSLPQGLALDPKTARISGKPVLPAERTEFTVTGCNMRGQVIVMIVLAVAGIWQNSNPRDWSRAMVQIWLKDELEMSEDDRSIQIYSSVFVSVCVCLCVCIIYIYACM